jgi:hypothetical protein
MTHFLLFYYKFRADGLDQTWDLLVVTVTSPEKVGRDTLPKRRVYQTQA